MEFKISYPQHETELRDYFAAQTLKGIDVLAIAYEQQDAEIIARRAYLVADAMLLEREKSNILKAHKR